MSSYNYIACKPRNLTKKHNKASRSNCDKLAAEAKRIEENRQAYHKGYEQAKADIRNSIQHMLPASIVNMLWPEV